MNKEKKALIQAQLAPVLERYKINAYITTTDTAVCLILRSGVLDIKKHPQINIDFEVIKFFNEVYVALNAAQENDDADYRLNIITECYTCDAKPQVYKNDLQYAY